MLLIKACRRCGGDLVYERDARADEAIAACVQCGFESYHSAVAASRDTAPDSPHATVKSGRRSGVRGRSRSTAPRAA